MPSITIDHIVYCVEDLTQAIINLESKLGVKAVIGGTHQTQGTKNALINLGDRCYLEVLAIDKKNTQIKAPRWMGIDLLQTNKITRWALSSQDIYKDSEYLKGYNKHMGQITGGSRMMTNGKTLTWKIAMPLSTPEVEIVPFITDWSASEAHPTDALDQPCKLLEIHLKHPNPKEIESLFADMNIGIKIISAETTSIHIIIECPNGIVKI